MGVYSTYRWSYLQNRNRGIDIESRHMDTRAGKKGWDELGDWDGHAYTTDTIREIDNKNLLYSTGDSTQCSAVPCCGAKSLQLYSTLCDLMDCSLSCSSVHGILQARILEWIAISSSRGSSQLRDWTRVPWVSCIVGGFFTTEPPGLHIQCSAAAAAKSLQSYLTLCDPRDSSPPGSPIPGILPARTLEWVAISFSNAWKWKVKVKLLSRVWLLATPWTAAYQASPSMGFSRRGYWSGVPLLSPLRPLLLLLLLSHFSRVRLCAIP